MGGRERGESIDGRSEMALRGEIWPTQRRGICERAGQIRNWMWAWLARREPDGREYRVLAWLVAVPHTVQLGSFVGGCNDTGIVSRESNRAETRIELDSQTDA